MFDEFLSFFGEGPLPGGGPETAEAFVGSLGGRAFGGGLMFAIAAGDLPMWRGNVRAAYGGRAGGLSPFAYDWLGDCLAEGDGGVRILELGTGEVLATGMPVASFLAEEVPGAHDQCLFSPFWRDWLASGGARPSYGRCVGYRVPSSSGAGTISPTWSPPTWTCTGRWWARRSRG
ncbi:hypothetical protein [Olsenella sp. Marseille-P4559]|uniref:hypothetical protein n=1 Tax=Olsenella sp. Marseille-P4559 TaxID=2364795 RepID=UPI0010317462|nr:hypothetical protein [Olsenella sp. Marseille-P4559]